MFFWSVSLMALHLLCLHIWFGFNLNMSSWLSSLCWLYIYIYTSVLSSTALTYSYVFTVESEYIVAGSCCAQLLWMKQTLKDYGIHLKQVPLYCDNESAIKIANNPVQHSKTKHIEIRHHFLRDHVMKEDIDIIHVNTEEQLADIFTKPLDEKWFCKLRCELNILESSNVLWLRTHPNTYVCWWLTCARHEVMYIFNQQRHTLQVWIH